MLAWTEDGDVAVWDTATGSRVGASPRQAGLRTAVLSPDGSRVVTAGDDGVARIRDVASGQEITTVRHALPVVAASFSADGRRLLTASLDRTAKIWDARTGEELVAFEGHESELASAMFSPGDRWVVTPGLDDHTARVWDARSGQELEKLHHPANVTSASFGGDDGGVLTLSDDFRARVFRCETCVPLGELVRLARGRLVPGPGK